MTTAVFPGTFDPITLGHDNLIARAAAMFERVVVAVAAGHHKQTLFTLDERVAMVSKSVKRFKHVRVEVMDGLMVEFVAKLDPKRDSKVVVRGVRNASDFDYEVQLAGMNRERIAAGALPAKAATIETVFLMPETQFQFLSASRVREIASLGGDVSAWVSPTVLALVMARVAERHRAAR